MKILSAPLSEPLGVNHQNDQTFGVAGKSRNDAYAFGGAEEQSSQTWFIAFRLFGAFRQAK